MGYKGISEASSCKPLQTHGLQIHNETLSINKDFPGRLIREVIKKKKTEVSRNTSKEKDVRNCAQWAKMRPMEECRRYSIFWRKLRLIQTLLDSDILGQCFKEWLGWTFYKRKSVTPGINHSEFNKLDVLRRVKRGSVSVVNAVGASWQRETWYWPKIL